MRLLVLIMCVACFTGCQTTNDNKMTVGMKHSLTRSAGDTAMTALLDGGADALKARNYVYSIYRLVEEGEVNRDAIRTVARSLAEKLEIANANGYIEALIAVIPSSIEEHQVIPIEYRELVVSFLRDGAMRALEHYRQ